MTNLYEMLLPSLDGKSPRKCREKMFTVTLSYVKVGEANITTAGRAFIEVCNFCCGSLRRQTL
jgi:hypothetical protein